ncbi:MAG: ATP synthase subunit I, partial [Betaproteobacteria bacterium]|nr:ATP synthase subunit I [Betaproteobacteria bacterium]
MARMQPESSWESPDNAEEEFTPLTAQQVQDLRRIQPLLSVWRVVAAQIGVGLLVALVSWGVSGKTSVGVSAGYGALAVVIPAALFARGLTRRMNSLHAGAAVLGFFVWEVAVSYTHL